MIRCEPWFLAGRVLVDGTGSWQGLFGESSDELLTLG